MNEEKSNSVTSGRSGLWLCEHCGHEVYSGDFKPSPIKWTDGHVCRFITEAEAKKRREATPKIQTCILCGKQFTEYGNDPWPVSTKGRCCNDCDDLKVTPARLRGLGHSEQYIEAVIGPLSAARRKAIQHWREAREQS